MAPETIVVGVDDSPVAASALSWAAEVARAFNAELVIVHARGLLEGARQADDLPDWLVALIDQLGADVMVRARAGDGAAAEVVLAVTEEERGDLIVVGRRGGGDPFSLTLGSTSREIASRATVPVTVVPSPPT